MINESYKEMRHTINVSRSTIYVDEDKKAGPWDGTVENRLQFIQDGIDSAAGGNTVYIFNETYVENIVVSKSLEFVGEYTENTMITVEDFGIVGNIFAECMTLIEFIDTQEPYSCKWT